MLCNDFRKQISAQIELERRLYGDIGISCELMLERGPDERALDMLRECRKQLVESVQTKRGLLEEFQKRNDDGIRAEVEAALCGREPDSKLEDNLEEKIEEENLEDNLEENLEANLEADLEALPAGARKKKAAGDPPSWSSAGGQDEEVKLLMTRIDALCSTADSTIIKPSRTVQACRLKAERVMRAAECPSECKEELVEAKGQLEALLLKRNLFYQLHESHVNGVMAMDEDSLIQYHMHPNQCRGFFQLVSDLRCEAAAGLGVQKEVKCRDDALLSVGDSLHRIHRSTHKYMRAKERSASEKTKLDRLEDIRSTVDTEIRFIKLMSEKMTEAEHGIARSAAAIGMQPKELMLNVETGTLELLMQSNLADNSPEIRLTGVNAGRAIHDLHVMRDAFSVILLCKGRVQELARVDSRVDPKALQLAKSSMIAMQTLKPEGLRQKICAALIALVEPLDTDAKRQACIQRCNEARRQATLYGTRLKAIHPELESKIQEVDQALKSVTQQVQLQKEPLPPSLDLDFAGALDTFVGRGSSLSHYSKCKEAMDLNIERGSEMTFRSYLACYNNIKSLLRYYDICARRMVVIRSPFVETFQRNCGELRKNLEVAVNILHDKIHDFDTQ